MICLFGWCLAAFLYAMGAVNMMLLAREMRRLKSIRPLFAMIIWPAIPFWALVSSIYDHSRGRPF